MNIITKTYNVYGFNELSDDVKSKVMNEYLKFILEVTSYDEMSIGMKKAIDRANSMHTPWFTGSYVYEYCSDELMESVNQYEYLENGDIFNE